MPSDKEKKTGEALVPVESADNGTALIKPENFKALTMDEQSVREIVAGNFGTGHQLNFSDLDRIKLPGAGGTAWQVPTVTGNQNRDELLGIIVAWTDKKAWWQVSFDEGGGAPPDCRSEDMVHGLGNPALRFNEKEVTLIGQGKASNPPKKDSVGFLCATCPHNVFGSARKGEGKDCQDKRLLFILDPASLLPFVVMAPATSIGPVKQYFGRLAKDGRPFFSVITSLKLRQEKGGASGKVLYSVIEPTMVAALEGEHLTAARSYSRMLAPMVQNDVMNQPALFSQQQPSEEQHAQQ